MKYGQWVWPPDPKNQRRLLKSIGESPHIMSALQAIAKSKEGLSNSEVDEQLADNSNWMTMWPVRQLTALGFIEYHVDIFGGPGRYAITELGRSAIATLTAQPTQPKPAMTAH